MLPGVIACVLIAIGVHGVRIPCAWASAAFHTFSLTQMAQKDLRKRRKGRLTLRYVTGEFEVTKESLGCYLPVEHIGTSAHVQGLG